MRMTFVTHIHQNSCPRQLDVSLFIVYIVAEVKYGILFFCICKNTIHATSNLKQTLKCESKLVCSYRNNRLHQNHEFQKEKHVAADNW